MTFQQLKYAIEIANWGSINEAAKRLFISQPSLSMAIKELEEELKITIFERTNKGINVSVEGTEFLGYARQVIEQIELLENRYLDAKPSPQHFSVSTQHYAFSVNAFVNLIQKYALEDYEFTLRETKTYEILDDVKNLRSEIGILYLNDFNNKVINKLLKESNLEFTVLFQAQPHVFISAKNPLAKQANVSLDDLDPYPCLSFEQGQYNSFHFSEEILSTLTHKKNIRVSDRATLFNLLIGLNGYTISTGVLSADLNGNNIIAVPLNIDETITVGWISHKNVTLSKLAAAYVQELEKVIQDYH
ncbi:HTH-type transcriptional regulator GltC [Desulfosporosinus acididurans]|uniref:HTH-type transcriptional regulator GltC n=1 Tax=Desulfosporosinus acididurans TaxID=476652 RepID=A0A0J1FW37_9FIRM|nr:LysR family transcriptional regulator [Desulfosporosinus acididurans]KLU67645.1 HTH-type transcriptional regulator GltC [Desulfosporosinus acididurans]